MTRSSQTFLNGKLVGSDFAVVVDRERGFIVDSGPYLEMIERAERLNLIYQSTAYIPCRWIDGGPTKG